MSIRIALDNAPSFFTNLDFVQGRVILSLTRAETVGNIIIKLEGESQTALALPDPFPQSVDPKGRPFSSGHVVTESHKVLYLVQQIYPDQHGMARQYAGASPAILPAGQHAFPFRVKLPLNNICGDPLAMASMAGIAGGSTPSGGLLGLGSFRIMDGTKQLMLKHVRSTLPPSLTGFPREAEIRYYLKVTIQRPGFFKENWRFETGFKFLPIEPPRPPKTSQEAFARRPFTFQPRGPVPAAQWSKNPFITPKAPPADAAAQVPPSIEMSARLPFPTILTCNGPVPIRLIAKKLAPSEEQVYLTSIEIRLLGFTLVRCHDLHNLEQSNWVLCSESDISIPLGAPTDPVGSEFVVPDGLWGTRRLPNTVAPSFITCNLSRRYEIEIKLGLALGLPSGKGKGPYPQLLYMPLKLSKVEIFSGIKPPDQLAQTATYAPQPQPPSLPPRRPTGQAAPAAPPNPLYPPQLGENNIPLADDAPPPSYDEAMAQNLSAPSERPAYSGVTAENAPSTIPQSGQPTR